MMTAQQPKKTEWDNGNAIIPISDVECERHVIGSILTLSSTFSTVREYLTKECFSDPKLCDIFEAIKTVDDCGDEVSMMNVSIELRKRRSAVTIPDLLDIQLNGRTGDITSLALHLVELDARRKMWYIGNALISSSVSEGEDVDDIKGKALKELTDLLSTATSNIHTLADLYPRLQELMLNNLCPDKPIIGTPTGFPEIDRQGGLKPSELIVVGGLSSHGKTSFVTSMLVSAIKSAHPVAMYSMEMTSFELAKRIAASVSGISASEISMQAMPDYKIAAVERSIKSIYPELCYFDDRSSQSVDAIINSIRTMHIKHHIKGAAVDYIQMLRSAANRQLNVEQYTAEVTRRFKNLAKELDIWIILLSQVNRDRDRPEPNIFRLRDSGQIQEAADVVMIVYRPEQVSKELTYSDEFSDVSIIGTAEIKVEKNRNGSPFKFICGFDAPTTNFYPLRELPKRNGTVSQGRNINTMQEDDPF